MVWAVTLATDLIMETSYVVQVADPGAHLARPPPYDSDSFILTHKIFET